MTSEAKKRFTVITNENYIEEKSNETHGIKRTYQYQTNPLREQFMRFTNEEGGKKFTVEDLLRW